MAEQQPPGRDRAASRPPRRPARPSWRDEVATISNVMGWVALALVAPSLAGPVLLVKAVSLAAGVVGNPVQSTLDDASVLATAAFATAPLTAAVALVGLAVLRQWVTNLLQFVVVAAAGLLVPALAAGLVDTMFARRLATITLRGNPLEVIAQLVGFYVQLYGAPYVIAGGVVGGFLAWAWARHILPHFA